MKARIILIAAVCALLAFSAAAQAATIDTVPVGNPGNADDTEGAGYGGVSYEYNIGKYEVTAGQYTEFLNAVAATDTYGLYNSNMDSNSHGCQITQNGSSGSYTYDFSGRPSGTQADWEDRPVNYVDWGDSARFANWLHNGQPGLDSPVPQDENSTEDGSYYLNGATSNAALLAVNREADWKWAISSKDESYKAAYHKNDGVTGNYFDYPTSSDSVPGRDMTEGTNPGNNANYYNIDYLIGSPYYRTEVGEFELSDSPYGTFDQGGNIWEWTEGISSLARVLQGGSFSYGNNSLHALSLSVYDPTNESYFVGFRVSEVPEPATLGLLLVGGLALFRRRSR